QKLRRELKVWARLKHENILPLLGVAKGYGPFTALVCPWMDNGTLSSYLECNAEQLSLRVRLELVSDLPLYSVLRVCSSYLYLTSFESNILISASGRAQLSDFGLSSIIIEFMGTSYLSSSMNGTARWAAPEIFAVQEDQSSICIPTEQSDIYSFGSIILQVLSGEVPYADLKRDVQVLLALSRGVKPTRPQTPWMNDRSWEFIQICWSTGDHGAKRPSAEEALRFIQGELSLL
ncbi:kinase-like domain-containing protein, partial [Melanogaster broomeanus]